MRQVLPSTRKSLVAALVAHNSFDTILRHYGIRVSKGTLSRALNGGSVSQAAENAIRAGLGLPACAYAVPPCPACGGLHVVADCQGRPVCDVVCIAPGYRVAKVRGLPIPRRLGDYPPPVLAYLLTHRKPML